MVRSCSLVLIFAVASVAWAQSPTHAETVVRQTYAKLAYAVNLGSIHSALQDPHLTRPALEAQIVKEGLQFQLSNFSSGRIIDIGQRKYNELVTKPDGSDTLSISTGNITYTEHDGADVLDATAKVLGWKPGHQSVENWDMPASTVFAQMKSQYSRYATYKVTVVYQGRSRTANAMFLFGADVLAIDPVTGNSALSSVAKSTIYPATLLKTNLRAMPVVADWLRSHQSFDETCTPGKEDVCCDPSTLQCGVASQDVNSSLSKPISQNNAVPTFAPASTVATSSTLTPNTARPPCNQFNVGLGPFDASATGSSGHITGSHDWSATQIGTCTYTAGTTTNGVTQCIGISQAKGTSLITENGVYVPPACHVDSFNNFDGVATGNGVTAIATSVVGGAVESCLACACSFSISLNAPPLGGISFPASSFFQQQKTYVNTCAGHHLPTPIVIDTTGRGYHLTSAQNGVKFDLVGDGHPIQTAWTDAESGNAFLALDRNGNGKIDSGKELFGDDTNQPESNSPNGYLALAVFDMPENGGNGDGIIDEHDRVWSSLRLWIDSNHDGISQPSELFTLPQLGVRSISLKYTLSRRTDEFGNAFRFKGSINPEHGDGVDRTIWDVVFAD
jgi:hypothetical protein